MERVSEIKLFSHKLFTGIPFCIPEWSSFRGYLAPIQQGSPSETSHSLYFIGEGACESIQLYKLIYTHGYIHISNMHTYGSY